MRLILRFKPEGFLSSHKVNKHTVQGAMYALLDDTDCYHILNFFEDLKISDFICSWVERNGTNWRKIEVGDGP